MKQQLCLLSTLLVCCLLAGSTVGSAQPFILSDQTLDDGAILSNDGKRLVSAPVEAVDYRIPEGVEVVAAYAFFNCADLQSITFPESVKVLEPHAFDGLRIITLYVPHDAPYLSELPSFFKIVKTGLQSYTVTFESHGGTAVAAQTIEEGSSAQRPADPVRTGYAFGGWYEDAAATIPYTFGTAVNSNLTLHAKWYADVVFTSVPSVKDIIATVDGRSVTFSLAAENYVYIIWDMGEGSEYTTYSNSVSHQYQENGHYTITATAVNAYGAAAPITYEVTIGDDEEASPLSVLIGGILLIIAVFLVVYYLSNLYWSTLAATLALIIYCALLYVGVLA